MSICVTKNQIQPNFNPIMWAAAGAAGGYIAKEALPVSQSEKEQHSFDKFVLTRKATVGSAVEEELNAVREIVANGTEDKGYQTYLDFVKNHAKPKEKRDAFLKDVVAKLPENAQATFTKLRKDVDTIVKDIKKRENFMFDATVIKDRPASKYMFAGALFATGVGYVKYAISKMSSPKA